MSGIRSVIQRIMSFPVSSESSSVKLSSAHLSKNEVNGWKWEVNHDGVIWSWYHPTASPSLSLPPSTTQKTDLPIKSQKYSLVDYWYTIHDGTVIPTINDY